MTYQACKNGVLNKGMVLPCKVWNDSHKHQQEIEYKVPQFLYFLAFYSFERKRNDLLIYLLSSPAPTQYQFFQIHLASENWCQVSLMHIIWYHTCQIWSSSLCLNQNIGSKVHFNCIHHCCTALEVENHTVLGSTAPCTCAFSLNPLINCYQDIKQNT